MNNTLHTWQISFGNIVDQNKKTICFLPERKNNDTAHLISAAPDLLQVVADYVLLCDLHDYVGAVPDAARQALRKAKGEA